MSTTGVCMWNLESLPAKKKLEQVQKFVLVSCTKGWDFEYPQLLSMFKSLFLENLRLYLCLCTMYKIVNELVDFPQHVFISKPPTHLRSFTSATLFIEPFARTNSMKNSYVPLTCHIWNTLPSYIRNVQSLIQFKKVILFCLYSE